MHRRSYLHNLLRQCGWGYPLLRVLGCSRVPSCSRVPGCSCSLVAPCARLTPCARLDSWSVDLELPIFFRIRRILSFRLSRIVDHFPIFLEHLIIFIITTGQLLPSSSSLGTFDTGPLGFLPHFLHFGHAPHPVVFLHFWHSASFSSKLNQFHQT